MDDDAVDIHGDVEIPYVALRRSTKASYLIAFEAHDEVWLPRRFVTVDLNHCVVRLPRWLAKREGLVCEAD